MPKHFQIKPITGFKFVIGRNFMTQATHIIVLPLFYFAFCLVYDPFNIQQYYSNGVMSYGPNIVMVTCIMLVTLIATRITFSFLIRKIDFNRWQYLSWCLAEVFIISAFVALYSLLIRQCHEGYMVVLKDSFMQCGLILIYPYLLIFLIRTILGKNEEISDMEIPRENNLVHFYDEHKRLKLTIAPSSILFIRSDFNYVIVYYLESGKVKNYQLRCSMKSIEDAIDRHTLSRCHRSYFVNPEHVSVLRKDKEGFIFAELNIQDLDPIPVSKSYYNEISSLL